MGKEKSGKWIKGTLVVAGLHSFIVGVLSMIFHGSAFGLYGLQENFHIVALQSFGAVMVIFGIGYFIAAYDVYRYWPIVMLGLFYKMSMPLLFLVDSFLGVIHITFNSMIVFNYLIWILPLGLILYKVYQEAYKTDTLLLDMFTEQHYPLNLFETSDGQNLEELVQKQPVLVVFLRHFGCTFCRETLQDLAKVKNDIDEMGTKLLVVHMGYDTHARDMLKRYNLVDVPRLSDPECILYKRFNLSKGRLMQIFGPKVLWRGLIAGIFKGNGIGEEEGDAFQMPGVFLLKSGKVIKKFVHRTAADRPDYKGLAKPTSSVAMNDGSK